MEPLLRAVRELGRRFGALGAAARFTLILGGAVLALAIGGAAFFNASATYQYAFTNLTPEDSSEAAAALKAAGINFRAEAGGSAIPVPSPAEDEWRRRLATAGAS